MASGLALRSFRERFRNPDRVLRYSDPQKFHPDTTCFEWAGPCDATQMLKLSRVFGLTCDVFGVSRDALMFLRLMFRSSSSLAAENLFLRKQLALYVERRQKPRRA